MRPILLLRPEPGASLSASRAAEMGIEGVETLPLFKVRPVDWTPPDPARFDAILMTSANAARHGGEGLRALRDLPVHAVGEATAAAARAAGLMVDEVGTGGVEALLERLPPDRRLLHLAGQHRRAPAGARQTIVPLAVYSSIAREHPPGVERLAGAIAVVHSPRAGQRLDALCEREGIERGSIAVAAISEDACPPEAHRYEQIVVAAAPRDRELLQRAAQLRDKVA
ncbi:uroporphyrinogen-III synthase [Sphingomicrobium astaxanthinifaciens]|uniref:uroporphyrinogen-III synthase n=1 Tax=Sphingomicrobium astaxanthinifaciens TaxID=1227949 RepID=UPI001FCC569F|nr:uroporphyrinogen-III synthase [Sphingomicrobium astaxanthinifaciens]MCJ7421217.1 uroporphyrinogen-III synthase [Sphingomicrobium astaxanthinifaciens]